MSRRHRAEKREVIPDPKFGDLVVTKFMNAIMYDGKKSVAETIVYGALDQVQSKARQEPVAVFHQALDNVVRDGAVTQKSSADRSVIGARAAFDLLHNHPRIDSTALQTVGLKGWDGFILGVVKAP